MSTVVKGMSVRARALAALVVAAEVATVVWVAGPAAAATVPDPPTAVRTSAGYRSVSVSWTPPANDGGAPITRYTVTAAPDGATCTATGTTCKVSGLTPGAVYSFSVVATNSAGTSAASPSVAAVPLNLPGAPTGVTVTNPVVQTDGTVTVLVRWVHPTETGGSPLTRFNATASPGGRRCSVSTSATTPRTSCKITGLARATSYTIVVAARTIAGTGPASLPAGPVLFDIPKAPTAVIVTPLIKSARISWTPTTSGDLPIKSFRVTSTPDGLTCAAAFDEKACTITGLREGVEYAFTVVAINQLGESAPSAPTAPLTPSAPPPPPASKLVVTTTFGPTGSPRIRLTWLAAPGLVGATSRISYLHSTTAPPTLATGTKIPARRVRGLPGDTGPRYAASVPDAAVKSPLAVSVFMVGANKRASTPVSVVLTQATVRRPVARVSSAGRSAGLRWQLRRADGTPLAGQRVVVNVRRAGTLAWTPKPLITNSGGWATLTAPFNGLTDVQFVYSGSNSYIGVAVPVFQQRVASAVSAQLSPVRIPRGGIAKLTGAVFPRKNGQPAYLQELVGGVWRSIAVTRTDALGRYGFALPTRVRGVRRFRVYVRADAQNVAGASGQRILTIV